MVSASELLDTYQDGCISRAGMDCEPAFKVQCQSPLNNEYKQHNRQKRLKKAHEWRKGSRSDGD